MRITDSRESTIPADVVSVAEAKLHCRIDHSTEDVLIARLIGVARKQCEQISQWAYTSRVLVSRVDRWPYSGCWELPYPPLQSVTSIVYTTALDEELPFDAASYVVDTHSTPGRILLKSGASWPSEELQVGSAIAITYVAGFGTEDDVPDPYKQAMLLLVGHLYENRESVVIQQGVSLVEVPQAVEWLLLTDRVN